MFSGSKHPYFNKKIVKTKHGLYADGDTLFKLGQIDIDQYEKWLQEKAEANRNT